MKFDGQTLAAILGFLGIVVTGVSGAWVATRTNRTEKEDTARATLEKTRDEAHEALLLLRDETIKALREDKTELEGDLAKSQAETAKAQGEVDECRRFSGIRIEELEATNDRLELGLVQLKKDHNECT